ncbi:MAG TPA: hypothetical protein VET23_04090 [Chitinophagaceae bacterium]|nr:hypothetical protein [Chitinophagaceae bacterium]
MGYQITYITKELTPIKIKLILGLIFAQVEELLPIPVSGAIPGSDEYW